MGLSTSPHAAPALPVDLLLRRAGVLDAILSSMPKHPNGTPGKKPSAPSVKRTSVQSFSTMVETLKARSLDGSMRLKLVSGVNQFRYVAATRFIPFPVCYWLGNMARDDTIRPMTLGNMRRNGVRGLPATDHSHAHPLLPAGMSSKRP